MKKKTTINRLDSTVFKKSKTEIQDSTEIIRRATTIRDNLNNITLTNTSGLDGKSVVGASRKSLIPPTLLTKPLPPEKLNLLTDEEKRLY